MFVGFLFMPESPRWLVFREDKEGQRVLGRVRQPHEVEAELKMIVRDHEDHLNSQTSKLQMYCKTLTSFFFGFNPCCFMLELVTAINSLSRSTVLQCTMYNVHVC